MDEYIFVVGRPYPGRELVDLAHARGYKLGIFLDDTIAQTKSLQYYDCILPIHFADAGTLQAQMGQQPLPNIVGLMCLYENYILAKAKLADILHLLSLSQEAARKCTDKVLMRQAFMDFDPTITPKFREVESIADLEEFVSNAKFPIYIKPANLVKSLLILLCNDMTQLRDNYATATATITELYAANRIYDRQPKILVEENISGQSYSIAAMVDGGGAIHFMPGVVEIRTARDMGIDDSYLYERHLPATLSPALSEKLYEVATAGIQALGLTGSAAHIELIADKASVKIVEIGARIGGYRTMMYKNCYDLDLLSLELDVALGAQITINTAQQAKTSVFEIFPTTEGHFVSLTDQSESGPDSIIKIKANPDQIIGPARLGYRAAAICFVSSSNAGSFATLRTEIESIQVEVTSL